MGEFRFKRFSVSNEAAAQKVGTDAVLLGAAMSLPEHVSGRRLRLLDIGTGTGIIALMAAQRLEGRPFDIEAIDIDPAAAAEAAANFAASPWASGLHASKLSLAELEALYGERAMPAGEHFSANRRPFAGFDAIFSNPPYFEDSLKAPDSRRSTARHTDTLSYRDIVIFAAGHLAENGILSLILPAETEVSLVRVAKSFGLAPFRILRIRTAPSKPFKRVIAEFRKGGASLVEDSLTIMDGPDRSAAYSALTADFYLWQPDRKLEEYIEKEIIPRYEDFDDAHKVDHARTVIEQSLQLADRIESRTQDRPQEPLDRNMIYAIAAYHDTGLCEGRKTHHLVSGRIIREDAKLRLWFGENQIETMAQAAEDHRASSDHEPRSIYGRIVAEADRIIDGETIVRRTIQFGMSHYPELDRQGHWQRMCVHLKEKYDYGGYLKLWIAESPNAARLEEFRQNLRKPGWLKSIFDKYYPGE